ncbi:MAG: hypothetical protein AAF597_02060, partial [Bacteroidota bacterium]
YRSTKGFDGYLLLNPQLKGGRYTLRAYTNWLGNYGEAAFFTKYIYVQELQPPSLLLELEPERESYAPGRTVRYTLTARNRQDRPIGNQPITAALRIDGKTAQQQAFITDADGVADLYFALPLSLRSYDVQLSATVEADGDVASVLRAVRILHKDVRLRFFPEGGQRANANHKIAFRATNKEGKPVDVSGRVLAGQQTLLTFTSRHNGYGHFVLPPVSDRDLRVVLDQVPDTSFALPEIGLFAVAANLQVAEESITLDISNNPGVGSFNLSLFREDSVLLTQPAFSGRIILPLTGRPPGVYTVTLTDETNRMRWERRFFRRPEKITLADFQPTPKGDRPGHTFTLHDAAGDKVMGDFSVAIVDDRPHTQQNDKQPHLVTQLLLQSQLTGTLYEPNDYFDPKQPQAMAALDDVLLCHGWRAYEWAELTEYAYAPLQTGLHGYVSRDYRNRKTTKPLIFNGKRLAPDQDSVYRLRLPPLPEASINPGLMYYSVGKITEYSYQWRNLIQVLPVNKRYTPPKASTTRKRAQLPKATTWSQEQMMAPAPLETASGLSVTSSQQLDEVVVVGYGRTMKSTTGGLVVQTQTDLEDAEYTIRSAEQGLYRPRFAFNSIPTIPL